MDQKAMEKRNLVAQWAFDTSPILGRFHLWLEDVEIEWLNGERHSDFNGSVSFVDAGMERMFSLQQGRSASNRPLCASERSGSRGEDGLSNSFRIGGI